MLSSSGRYEEIGVGYSRYRRPEARIAQAILGALGDAKSILNVGAGAGSYEPDAKSVVALEPSIAMIEQRRSSSAPVVRGVANYLPFDNNRFDAAMAVLTVHHWEEQHRALREMARVARRRIVVLTWDPTHDSFWLTRDYFPEILQIDKEIFPSLDVFRNALGEVRITPVLVPYDCTDGFLGAYWRRPERYLDESARAAISTFSRIENVEDGLNALRTDLDAGEWSRRNEEVLRMEYADLGYRLVVADLQES